MHWIAAKVFFTCDNENLATELISDLFYTLGVKGVVIDDPRLEPVEGWGADAVPRPEQSAVTGYLPADDHLAPRLKTLESTLADLSGSHNWRYKVQFEQIDEEDWAESWKAFFFPQQITPRIVVKPTWRDYTPQPDQLVIEIDPGMAFGTGTHPTTALCLQLLEKHIRPGQSVLDVGTGSGILLIAAAKLGARTLAGVDLDPLAIAVARENLQKNGIVNEVELTCGHLLDTVSRKFDLIVANILADVILDLLDHLGAILKPDSLFIASGIIQAYAQKVVAKMIASGFQVQDLLEQGDWVAIVGRWTGSGRNSSL